MRPPMPLSSVSETRSSGRRRRSASTFAIVSGVTSASPPRPPVAGLVRSAACSTSSIAFSGSLRSGSKRIDSSIAAESASSAIETERSFSSFGRSSRSASSVPSRPARSSATAAGPTPKTSGPRPASSSAARSFNGSAPADRMIREVTTSTSSASAAIRCATPMPWPAPARSAAAANTALQVSERDSGPFGGPCTGPRPSCERARRRSRVASIPTEDSPFTSRAFSSRTSAALVPRSPGEPPGGSLPRLSVPISRWAGSIRSCPAAAASPAAIIQAASAPGLRFIRRLPALGVPIMPRARPAFSGLDEVDGDLPGDDPRLVPAVEEELDRLAAALPHLDRHLVDPHADEAVRDARVHAAREAHSVLERLAAVRERVLDRLPHELREPLHQRLAEVAPHGVAAQRQRQPGLLLPPDAEVEHLRQPLPAVGELALVDHEAGLGTALAHLVEDAVERHDARRDARREELERQVRG